MIPNLILPRGIPRGVWVLSATSALISTGFGMAVPLIPVYGSHLGATAFQIGLLMAGFFAGRLLAEIPAGLAADRMGRRPVLLAALLGYTATCFGYALSDTTELLIAFRLLQGLSSGFFGVAARSLVSDLCDASRRGAGQGVFSASFNLGFVAGPVVGAVMAQRYDMSTPFFVAGIMCAVAFVGLLWVLLGSRPATAKEKDGAQRAAESRPRDVRLVLLALANMAFWAGMSVVMTLFPIAGEKNIPGGIEFVGVALTASGLFGLVFGPAAGRLSDKIGRAPLMTMGALLSASEGASLLMETNPVVIAACFGLGGIGAAAFSNGLFAALGDLTAWKGRGTVTGAVSASGVLGGMVGGLIAPSVWEATDLATPFGLQIGFALLSAVAALILWKASPPRASREQVVSDTIIQG